MQDKATYGSDWSMDEIHDFISGSLSSEQLVEFNNDMKQDPFLKDAVDGYQGHAKLYAEHHLQRLKKQFGAKKPATSSRIWIQGAIAASIVLAIAGWFLFNRSTTGNSITADIGEIEKTESLPRPQPVEDETSLFDTTNMSKNRTATDISNPVQWNQNANKTDKRDPIARRRTRPSQKRIGGVVSGTVIDGEGQPLRGANVFFPNNEAAITTDFNGNFAVELKAYDSSAIVNYTGYSSASFQIKDGQKQQFQLIKEDSQDEVAVLSAPTGSLEADADIEDEIASSPPVTEKALSNVARKSQKPARATPEKGFKKYEKYIRRNLKYPSEARKNKVEGEVIIHFKVLPNGEYFDLRVMKSLGYGCDEEAMRLVKQGPQWISEIPNGIGEATFTVTFSKD